MNNVNQIFAPIIGFMATGKVEPMFRSDDQIIEDMKRHNSETLSNISKEGQTIFTLKHYITLDEEEVGNATNK